MKLWYGGVATGGGCTNEIRLYIGVCIFVLSAGRINQSLLSGEP